MDTLIQNLLDQYQLSQSPSDAVVLANALLQIRHGEKVKVGILVHVFDVNNIPEGLSIQIFSTLEKAIEVGAELILELIDVDYTDPDVLLDFQQLFDLKNYSGVLNYFANYSYEEQVYVLDEYIF